MSKARHVFIHSPELDAFAYPSDCPFVTRRAGMARATLAGMGLLSGGDRAEVAPVRATREELEAFHTPRYLDVLREAEAGRLDVEGLEMGLGTADTPIFKGMVPYVTLASGGTLTGARRILDGDTRVAFNPSGGYHHAHPARAGGFCYVNDIVLGCMALADAGRRVFFVDVDVHHCDGVQDAFYDRSDVMTLSFHEDGRGLFPGTGFADETGVGKGEGYCANVPLPPGTYDDAYVRAFRAVALPLLDAYDPDVIVLELGMDCLAGDPLAHLALTNNAYATVVETLRDRGTPLLVTGGGGYNPENTARGWALAWSILCGADEHDTLHVGLGGVMLESTEWHGGLRDRALAPDAAQRRAVDPVLDKTLAAVKRRVFPKHGLRTG
jgi:acetoin utilization protein AcuC